MAKTTRKPAEAPKPGEPNIIEKDQVAVLLQADPALAAELGNLTRGEQIIRLRQRGLLDFDVQE